MLKMFFYYLVKKCRANETKKAERPKISNLVVARVFTLLSTVSPSDRSNVVTLLGSGQIRDDFADLVVSDLALGGKCVVAGAVDHRRH